MGNYIKNEGEFTYALVNMAKTIGSMYTGDSPAKRIKGIAIGMANERVRVGGGPAGGGNRKTTS